MIFCHILVKIDTFCQIWPLNGTKISSFDMEIWLISGVPMAVQEVNVSLKMALIVRLTVFSVNQVRNKLYFLNILLNFGFSARLANMHALLAQQLTRLGMSDTFGMSDTSVKRVISGNIGL